MKKREKVEKRHKANILKDFPGKVFNADKVEVVEAKERNVSQKERIVKK